MNNNSRAELFAQQALADKPERIKAHLRDLRVVVGISKSAADTKQGQIGLVTATNILCRLGLLMPNLYIDVPANTKVRDGVPLLPAGEPLGDALLSLTQKIAVYQPDYPKRCLADRIKFRFF